MEAATTLPVRRVPFSYDIEKPGDYCFIPKREPIRKFEPEQVASPTGFWRWVVWFLKGRPSFALKEIVEIVWPDYDAIILNCPHCSQPIATTKDHRIVMDSCPICYGTGFITKKAGWTTLTCGQCGGAGKIVHEPLTIEKPLACAYSRDVQRDSQPTVFFTIKDGNIMPA
jgi:hypothetical protein